jgi:hypothetical protein
VDWLEALEIEPRRFGLVVKDPRLPKRVDIADLVTFGYRKEFEFIAVTGLGFRNKTDSEG